MPKHTGPHTGVAFGDILVLAPTSPIPRKAPRSGAERNSSFAQPQNRQAGSSRVPRQAATPTLSWIACADSPRLLQYKTLVAPRAVP
eukprot:1646193-Prymnesium_polylepis.1